MSRPYTTNRFNSAFHGFTFLAISLCSAAAIAAPVINPSVEPSQIERRFQEQPRPSTRPDNIQREVAPAKVSNKDASKRFVLRSVDVQGSTVYDAGAFAEMYQGQVGQTVSLGQMQALAEAISNKYRQDGYILSQAVLPKQNVNDGKIVIRVVEGYVANVGIQGEHKEKIEYRNLVAEYGEKIKAERPLRVSTLERYLLLIDDLPGVTAKGVLRPSSTQGAADLVVLMDHKMLEASANVNNRGTKFVGRTQMGITAAANSALGLYDRTLFRYITTGPIAEELNFFDFQHEEQLGSEGTKLKLFASHARTEPGETLKILDIEGESDFFRVQVESPIIRSRKENYTPRVLFDVRNSDTDILGTEFFDDRLRVLRAGVAYDRADSYEGVNFADFEISQGLDIFGATDNGANRSRIDGEAGFTKLNLLLSRNQTLPNKFSVFASASGQYSFDPLLSSEEFAIGGVDFGSAYDPSEITGDHGLAFKAELRYGDVPGWQYLNSYQFFGYYDIGAVWQEDTLPGVEDRQSLASTGLGVRANFNPYLSGTAEVGFPLTRDVANEGDDDPRFFFSVTGRF